MLPDSEIISFHSIGDQVYYHTRYMKDMKCYNIASQLMEGIKTPTSLFIMSDSSKGIGIFKDGKIKHSIKRSKEHVIVHFLFQERWLVLVKLGLLVVYDLMQKGLIIFRQSFEELREAQYVAQMYDSLLVLTRLGASPFVFMVELNAVRKKFDSPATIKQTNLIR